MKLQVKIQVLAVGEITSCKNTRGNEWHRRAIQVFDGDTAGNIQVYDTLDNLSNLRVGHAMADIVSTAGDRGSIDLRFTKVEPVVQAQKAA